MPDQRPAALAEYWSKSYLPVLDGLRAISFLLVMFNHVHERVLGGIQGRIGVDIFFVLSGFLTTTLLIRERERHGNISLKGFYTRRFFRIVPYRRAASGSLFGHAWSLGLRRSFIYCGRC